MIEYKVLCSNFPPDKSDLDRMAQEDWELAAVCTIHPADDVDKHLANKPTSMTAAGIKVRYTWYFKRIV